jgi:hypothetical protein
MKSYLIYFSILWALGIILMGLFIRVRSKHKFPEDDAE